MVGQIVENFSAQYWIEKLKLIPHPEGGFFKEVYRSNDKVFIDKPYNSHRVYSTSIYFLLTKNSPSHFHKLSSDETWHFYDGASISLHLIYNNGYYEQVQLGLENDSNPQFTILRDTWFAAETISNYTLIGCTVAPGFEFEDFELSDKDTLSDKYPQHNEIITKFALSR